VVKHKKGNKMLIKLKNIMYSLIGFTTVTSGYCSNPEAHLSMGFGYDQIISGGRFFLLNPFENENQSLGVHLFQNKSPGQGKTLSTNFGLSFQEKNELSKNIDLIFIGDIGCSQNSEKRGCREPHMSIMVGMRKYQGLEKKGFHSTFGYGFKQDYVTKPRLQPIVQFVGGYSF
jgi:hypothetical protein